MLLLRDASECTVQVLGHARGASGWGSATVLYVPPLSNRMNGDTRELTVRDGFSEP